MNYNKKLKIIIIGDTNTGKTTLIRNYLDYDIQFLSMTVALQYYFTEKYYSGDLIKINFCDISGDKSYYYISKNYLHNADGIIMIYDIYKKETIDNLHIWKKLILENNKEIINKILIIGNYNNKNKTIENSNIIDTIENNNVIDTIDSNNIIDNKIINLFIEYPNIEIEEYKIDFYNDKKIIKKIINDYVNEIYSKIKLVNNLENNNDIINISLIKETQVKKNNCCTMI